MSLNLDEALERISAHPDVQDAVAFEMEVNNHRSVVIAVVPHVFCSAIELRSLAIADDTESEPPVMLIVETIARATSGEVDGPCMLAAASETDAVYIFAPPRSECEIHLTRLLEQILDVSPVGVTDDFYELGLDSLHAVELSVEVERTLGVTLDLRTLFAYGTVRELASALVSPQ